MPEFVLEIMTKESSNRPRLTNASISSLNFKIFLKVRRHAQTLIRGLLYIPLQTRAEITGLCMEGVFFSVALNLCATYKSFSMLPDQLDPFGDTYTKEEQLPTAGHETRLPGR